MVADVGEPFDFGRHVGEFLELGGGQQPGRPVRFGAEADRSLPCRSWHRPPVFLLLIKDVVMRFPRRDPLRRGVSRPLMDGRAVFAQPFRRSSQELALHRSFRSEHASNRRPQRRQVAIEQHFAVEPMNVHGWS
jgi:hypothetical protein